MSRIDKSIATQRLIVVRAGEGEEGLGENERISVMVEYAKNL